MKEATDKKSGLAAAIRRFRITAILWTLLMMALGVFLLVHPGDALLILGRVIGGILLAAGIYNAVILLLTAYRESWAFFNTLRGILALFLLIIGVAIASHPEIVTMFYSYVLAIVFGSIGVTRLASVGWQREVQDPKWFLTLAGGILAVGFAAVMIFAPFSSQAAMMRAAGLALVCVSIWGLYCEIRGLTFAAKTLDQMEQAAEFIYDDMNGHPHFDMNGQEIIDTTAEDLDDRT